MPKRPIIKAADLFCGAGGTSKGLLEACRQMGFELDLVAVNHWDIAIASHQANHPYARHECASIDAVDPRKLVPGGRLNLLVASPECTHHSNARGGRPMNDQSRASAWLLLRWIELLYVDNIIIENVKEFRSWGPLGVNGRPLKSKRGEFYYAFIETLKRAGYNVEDRVLNAADYGDPTTRERLFLIARRGNKKIIWPAATHAPAEKLKKPNLFKRELKPWVPAREIIDWNIPGQSIFNRKKPLARKTLERIYAGLKKFGGPNAEPFLIVLRNHMDARPLSEPVPTLAANGNHVGLVEPFTFAHQRRGNQPQAVSEPMQTLTASSSDFALVEPQAFLLPNEGFYGGNAARSIDEPLNTVTAGRGAGAVVEPVVVNYRGKSKASSISSPLPTQTTKDHLAVVESQAYLLPQHSNGELRPVDKPVPTVATAGAISLVEPFIVPHQRFDRVDVDSVERPLRTLVGGNARRVQVCEPVLIDLAHGQDPNQTPEKSAERRCQSINHPIPTLTGSPGKAVVSADAFLVDVNHGKTHGSEGSRAQSINEPVKTITAGRRGKGVVQPCLIQYNGTATAQSVNEPMNTVTGKDRYALVTTEKGETFALDIRLRMLRPHELAAAMSLKNYKLMGRMEDQVKQIGNAVPVQLAKALCAQVLQ
jgi:DNA (cytosine-5)-methyltransferase 1